MGGLAASRHNIIGRVRDSDAWYVVNLLAGSADMLTAGEAARLREGRPDDEGAFVSRGYLVDPEEEECRYRQAYLDFLDARERDEVQLFFVPWYGCNFACDYCYQSGYSASVVVPGPEVLDAFFAHVDRELAGRRKYVTLFGGEPLLPGPTVRAMLEGFVERSAARGIELAVVTNGYHLQSALPVLRGARLREVQVTLDGPREVHDRRRPLRGGGGTFDAIVAGIDAALAADVPINLRAVVDRENLEALPALAALAREHGWTGHPRFKTQLGRNYELHHCHAAPQRLFTRLELYEALFELTRRRPEVLEFHRPAYSISRFLFENGETPPPLFDACTGCKTEWAFDGAGRIYACTATVGKDGEELGTFWPTVSRNDAAIAEWEDRDVLGIEACRSCEQRLACGGGCAAVAKNRTGDLHAPDCRPIRELLGLGVAAYAPPEVTG
ncbi:MAG: radical SAM protein [Deltaproteobacteria bacterium]|nr:radical SAM protein [Deltaproteobacteria bacterium]